MFGYFWGCKFDMASHSKENSSAPFCYRYHPRLHFHRDHYLRRTYYHYWTRNSNYQNILLWDYAPSLTRHRWRQSFVAIISPVRVRVTTNNWRKGTDGYRKRHNACINWINSSLILIILLLDFCYLLLWLNYTQTQHTKMSQHHSFAIGKSLAWSLISPLDTSPRY